jgi:cytoskeletal protein CcmA (bactofilin family)
MRTDTEPIEPPPLVPQNGLFEGQVAVVGETVIAGTVHGSLRGPGHLKLARGAQVKGQIECEIIECHGAVTGKVTARRRAYLGAGTRLEGDLAAPIIQIDDEAIWNGLAQVGHSQ